MSQETLRIQKISGHAGPVPGETPAAYRDQLAQWHAERERLETGLAQQVPEMNLEQQLRAADRRAFAYVHIQDAPLSGCWPKRYR